MFFFVSENGFHGARGANDDDYSVVINVIGSGYHLRQEKGRQVSVEIIIREGACTPSRIMICLVVAIQTKEPSCSGRIFSGLTWLN
jgi:hypothetical protein